MQNRYIFEPGKKKIGVKLPKIFILNICNTDGHKWQNSINFSSSGCRFDI